MSDIEYEIIRSNRKTIAIEILKNLRVVVRCPKLIPKYRIEKFVDSKRDWILTNLSKMAQAKEDNNLQFIDCKQIEELKIQAKDYIPKRVEYFANIMGVSYNRITIRCQKSRWGSCSTKGNLNFNCLLMLTNDDVIDYVVVHELCHLKQMNHSKVFWQEVGKVMPNYKDSYNWLKKNGRVLISNVADFK